MRYAALREDDKSLPHFGTCFVAGKAQRALLGPIPLTSAFLMQQID
jgi:hypothetical protein